MNYAPRNLGYFNSLLSFGNELLTVCANLGINPIAYGSLAYLYYTKDFSIEINDFDFLVPEIRFENITEMIHGKDGYSYELTTYNSLKIFQGKTKISFDGIEHYLKDISRDSVSAGINGITFNILNLESLKQAYRQGVQSIPVKKEIYDCKLERLNDLK